MKITVIIPKIIKKNSNKTLFLLIIVFSIILVFVLIKVFGNSNKRYKEMENKLIEAAQAYVINNNVIAKEEMYIDANKLNVSLASDCSLTSGVIFDGREYIPNLICEKYQTNSFYNPNTDNNVEIEYRLIPNEKTVDDVTIIVSTNIKNFDYIELPNNEKKNEKYVTYKVNENGSYIFNIYDKNGNKKEKVIDVNNIELIDYGTCTAKWKNDSTLINVNIKDGYIVNTYEYFINNKSESINDTGEYSSKTIKPTDVYVKIKLNDGKIGKIKCNIDEKTEPQIVTNENGKNCLEGHYCYVQFDYSSSKYPYCSMSDNPNSCGGIGRNGCSITSVSMAIANMGVISKKGTVYNPFTVHEELYPFRNRSTGECDGGCSGWTNMKRAITNSGLSATKAQSLNRDAFSDIISHLQKGYPIIVHAKSGAYAQTGHYMALLAVRDDNYVFLSDPSNKSGINKSKSGSKQYYSDTWIPLDDLVTGSVDNYMLVGPAGLF